ncbi:MAG: methyltransferase domain-containing protein [Dermatophilaceae bacterium]
MTLDVQYGPEVSSVYDSLIGSAVPVDATIDRLRPHLTGANALEVGVGSGRVARPVAAMATRLVGIDNSRWMLAEFRARGVPSNVELVDADFRRPLTLEREFDAAYSTLGSLACVRSREELVAALGHIRDVLVAGASFSFEYYCAGTYRPLADLDATTIRTPDDDGYATFTTTLEDDILTMGTCVEKDGAPPVRFDERILLLDAGEVEACLREAGFVVEQGHRAQPPEPYDWHLARNPEN